MKQYQNFWINKFKKIAVYKNYGLWSLECNNRIFEIDVNKKGRIDFYVDYNLVKFSLFRKELNKCQQNIKR